MSQADFTFASKREAEEPLSLDFVASSPAGAGRSARGPAAFAGEDRPLYLDPGARGPQRKRPEATYHGFAREEAKDVRPTGVQPPLRRPPRSNRGLLVVGLAAVMALSVAGALWTYSAFESRMMSDDGMEASPAPASAAAQAPPPTPPLAAATQLPPAAPSVGAVVQDPPVAPSVATAQQVAPVKPLPEAGASEPSVPPEAAPSVPAPSPAAAEARAPELAAAAPEAAAPVRPEPPKARRPARSSPRPGDSAATARANFVGAYAPASTLSAQAAAQPPVDD